MPVIDDLYRQIGRPVPHELRDWEAQVDGWCAEYAARAGESEISEINLDFAVYLFDHLAERVVLAYALSVEQLHRRDTARMAGFPNLNAGVKAALGDKAFQADKGHFLGHASGGILDINLFPQRRELNRGWSAEGKRFRAMERYVAGHPGALFYHRPIYDDGSWIPDRLEYGVLREDGEWWTDTFQNK